MHTEVPDTNQHVPRARYNAAAIRRKRDRVDALRMAKHTAGPETGVPDLMSQTRTQLLSDPVTRC